MLKYFEVFEEKAETNSREELQRNIHLHAD